MTDRQPIDHSSDRSGVFAGSDPFVLVKQWMDDAAKTEINDPNAMALATVDAAGCPNVRIVLLKEIEDAGFVFYTNYNSAKGQELIGSGLVAFCLYWKSTERQVRVRGRVTQETGPQADAYYNSRGLDSRIGAHASQQSQPLTSRDVLMERFATIKDEKSENPARPEHWGGFRVTPHEFEFWAAGDHRLHNRFRWSRDKPSEPWEISRLNP